MTVTTSPFPPVMTTTEAAIASRLSERTLPRRISSGELRARRVGGRLLILGSDLQRFVGTEDKDVRADGRATGFNLPRSEPICRHGDLPTGHIAPTACLPPGRRDLP